MIYLDYAATTMVDKKVLDTFNKVCTNYIGNSNSLHSLGVKSKELEEYATNNIARLLNVKPSEIIYTSSSSESNNTAIKGICLKYQNRGRHIITSSLEHSSVIAPINYLINLGFEVDFVNIKEDGTVDLEHLKSLIRDDTILVSLSYVDSELGIIQPIKEINKIIKTNPKTFFHVDCTQALGKIKIDFNDMDLATISSHKIYGLPGIALLIKKENIVIEPLIHGGKSTTIYRAGTPALPLVVSLMRALELVLGDIDYHNKHIEKLNLKIKQGLSKYDKVYFNTTDKSIKDIINISIIGIKPETFIHALEEYEIYVSTKSACTKANTLSNSVLALTKDRKRAESTVRISISYKTTEEEIDFFLEKFDECYNHLLLR